MTKKSLNRRFFIVTWVYLVAVIAGVCLQANGQETAYDTFKDLIPFILAIPAVWLGHCLQRRASYLQQLRILWSQLVDSIQETNSYLSIKSPSQEQHLLTLRKLSTSIDEVRGVFSNISNKNTPNGLYPFEPIKNIYQLIEKLNPSKLIESDREKETTKVFALWSGVRNELLREFDREAPTFHHSHWVDSTKSTVYEEHNIEKHAS